MNQSLNLDTQKIDLVIWNTPRKHTQGIKWPLGQIWQSDYNIESANHLVHQIKENRETSEIFFWDQSLGMPDPDLVKRLCNKKDELWHAGLCLGTAGLPGLMNFVFPTWMLTRDPASSIEATSWRVSLSACLVRTEVIRQLGFLQPNFRTLDGAALEWGHRCIVNGVFCRHEPDLIKVDSRNTVLLPAIDELSFILNRFGKRWALWATQRAVLSGYWSLKQGLHAWQKLAPDAPVSYGSPYQHQQEKKTGIIKADPKVSVLIPTIDRYPYLQKLLQQLRLQTVPADEIIIVDQTLELHRQSELYTEFEDLPIKVLYRAKPGQCSARNAGLQVSQGEYILLLDDDVEVPNDLIEQHLISLQRFEADASVGVVHEIGSLPTTSAYVRASDVFPAGNSMVRRQALQKSGLFELAFDQGSRADADLGMRLYLSGARLVLDQSISILHHHAPRGGLRTHRARAVTYSNSRQSLWKRNLASPTEMYLILRHFKKEQQREHNWLNVLGTFSVRGGKLRRLLKVVVAVILLPNTLWQLHRNRQRAQQMMTVLPHIPTLL